MGSRPRRTANAVAGVVLLASAVAACSGGDDSSGAGPGAPAGSSATDSPVVTEVAFGKITGALPSQAKDTLSDQVQEVVDGWFDAAYLGDDGDDGGDGGDPWPGFTKGAAAEARADGDLMSNRGLAPGTEVEAKKRAVKIDVLAVKKRPVGVTAHITLKFTASGADQQVVRIGGRLYLTPGKDGWQVFGYDVTKADV